MPRISRRLQHTESACYHVLNRGHNRETVFRDRADYRYFLDLLARYGERFAVKLYHYCLMPNHFHLLLQLDQAERLSPLVAGLLRAYVHYYNRRYQFVGHLWQGRFKGQAVDTERYLLSCGRYIERNPLAAGLCRQPWSYPWSSCKAYVLGRADPLLASNPWYEAQAATPAARQQRWRAFLLGEDPHEELFQEEAAVVGDASFRQRFAEHAGRPMPRGRGRPPQGRG